MKPYEIPPDLIEWVAKKYEKAASAAYPEQDSTYKADEISEVAALAIEKFEE